MHRSLHAAPAPATWACSQTSLQAGPHSLLSGDSRVGLIGSFSESIAAMGPEACQQHSIGHGTWVHESYIWCLGYRPSCMGHARVEHIKARDIWTVLYIMLSCIRSRVQGRTMHVRLMLQAYFQVIQAMQFFPCQQDALAVPQAHHLSPTSAPLTAASREQHDHLRNLPWPDKQLHPGPCTLNPTRKILLLHVRPSQDSKPDAACTHQAAELPRSTSALPVTVSWGKARTACSLPGTSEGGSS